MNNILQINLPLFLTLIVVVLVFTFLGRRIYDFVTRPFLGPSLFSFLIARVGPRKKMNASEVLIELAGILFDVLAAYLVFLLIYDISGVLSVILVQVFSGIQTSVNVVEAEALVKGFLIIGALAAILTRIFALYYSTEPIKTFYFQLILVAGGLFLTAIHGDLRPLFLSVMAKSPVFLSGFFFQTYLSLIIAVVGTEMFVLLPPSKIISYDLFRERADSIEQIEQVILGSDVRDIVLRELENEEKKGPIQEIRWATGAGYEEIANWILSRRPNLRIKIITTKEVAERWFSGNSRLRDLQDFVKVVGEESFSNYRCLLIDKRLALRGAPLYSKYATTAIKIMDPMRVHSLANAFDSWYDGLQ